MGPVVVEPVELEDVELEDVEFDDVELEDVDVVTSVVGFVADVVVLGSVVPVLGLSESAQPAAPVTKPAAVAARKARRSSVLRALMLNYLEPWLDALGGFTRRLTIPSRYHNARNAM